MAADFVSRWADFTGGDYGLRDPSKAGRTQFRGTNVVLYDSELLGVRPGLAKLNIAGLPNHPDTVGPRGFDIWNDQLILVLDQPWKIPIPPDKDTATTAASMGTFVHGDAVGPVRMAQFRQDLYFNVDGHIYKYADPSGPLTQISVPARLKGLTRWNYYLVAWDIDNPQRIWFTDVGEFGADPDVWGPNNFLDVGGNEPITGLFPMYNYLYAAKQSGWYAVSGILNDRPFVRRVTNGNGMLDDRQGTITADNRVLYWGKGNAPVWFNGDTAYFDKNFRIEGLEQSYPADSVVASPTQRRVLMLGEQATDFDHAGAKSDMLYYDNGQWSTHAFSKALGGIAGHDLRVNMDGPGDVMYLVNRASAIGTPVEIYSFHTELSRPARASDPWSDPNDQDLDRLLEGAVDLPAFYDAQSRMCMVRSVIVQFRHWPSEGDEDLNELQCQIKPMGKFEGGSMDSKPQVWTQPADRAPSGGTDETWRLGFGSIGWANGFQISFPRMRGVAIRSVEAHVEVRTARL